jgi:hypothetical protein
MSRNLDLKRAPCRALCVAGRAYDQRCNHRYNVSHGYSLQDCPVGLPERLARSHGPTGPGIKTFDLDQNFEPDARNRRPTVDVGGSEDARSIMSLCLMNLIA